MCLFKAQLLHKDMYISTLIPKCRQTRDTVRCFPISKLRAHFNYSAILFSMGKQGQSCYYAPRNAELEGEEEEEQQEGLIHLLRMTGI